MIRPLIRLLPFLAATLIASCTLVAPGKDGPAASPLAAEDISVTKLGPATAGPAGQGATKPAEALAKGAKPGVDALAPDLAKDAGTKDAGTTDTGAKDAAAKPDAKDAGTKDAGAKDAASDTAPAAEVVPPAPLSPEAQACKRKGGSYLKTGDSNLRSCVRLTGEGAKHCTSGKDCKGACLARSGTCSPADPLFGCNEILQDDGRRVNLCLD